MRGSYYDRIYGLDRAERKLFLLNRNTLKTEWKLCLLDRDSWYHKTLHKWIIIVQFIKMLWNIENIVRITIEKIINESNLGIK